MSKLNRKFRGIWISAEIWVDERLSAVDKVLLAEIHYLDNEDGCYASNEYLAKFLQVSISTISRSISKLRKEGFIGLQCFNGRNRFLKSNVKIVVEETHQNDKSAISK